MMFANNNQQQQQGTKKSTVNKGKGRIRVSPRTSRRDAVPDSSPERSMSRSKIRCQASEERETTYVEETKNHVGYTRTVLRSSALDLITKTKATQSTKAATTVTEPSSEESVTNIAGSTQVSAGDTDSVDEILANSILAPELTPPSSDGSDGQDSLLHSMSITLEDASQNSSDHITFYPPSNQLEMEEETGAASAEENGGNTFPVVSPDKRKAKDESRPPTINDFAALLDSRLDRFATKSDFDGVINQVNQNTALISSNRDDILALRSDIAELKEVTGRANVRGVIESVMRETPLATTGQRSPPKFRAGSRCKEQETARLKKYNLSRTSIRVWPINGSNPTEISQNLKTFLADSLEVVRSDIPCLGIRWVERTRVPPRSKIRDEIRITFSSQFYRDEFASKGKLLADHIDDSGASTAGFRLDIPDFLSADFKALNDYGYLMRRTHGKMTRKYIKYNDEECGLFLELPLPEAGSYLKMSPELARSLMVEGERVQIDRHRKDLLARPSPTHQQSPALEANDANLIPVGPSKHTSKTSNNDTRSALLRMSGLSPTDGARGPGDSTPGWRPCPAMDMWDIEY